MKTSAVKCFHQPVQTISGFNFTINQTNYGVSSRRKIKLGLVTRVPKRRKFTTPMTTIKSRSVVYMRRRVQNFEPRTNETRDLP